MQNKKRITIVQSSQVLSRFSRGKTFKTGKLLFVDQRVDDAFYTAAGERKLAISNNNFTVFSI